MQKTPINKGDLLFCTKFEPLNRFELNFKRLATGKNEKEYSWHVPAVKFMGMKQLV